MAKKPTKKKKPAKYVVAIDRIPRADGTALLRGAPIELTAKEAKTMLASEWVKSV